MKENIFLLEALAVNRYVSEHREIRNIISRKYGSMRAFIKKHHHGNLLDGVRALAPFSDHDYLLREPSIQWAREELQRLEATEAQTVPIWDKCYPILLKDCPDAPPVLFIKSATPLRKLTQMRFFSLTGTRDMSPYGRECVNAFLRYISGQKNAFAVVSGLAVGTDTCLHQGALEMGINTIAVLPTGLDAVFPSANKALAERIASTPGCALLSCFPTQTLPEPSKMIRRNHIIAGMSLETYVTETKHAGGAIITARLAREYDRKVYAFPGRMGDERSRGCNELIREETAKLFLG